MISVFADVSIQGPSCGPLMQRSIVLPSCRKLKEEIRGSVSERRREVEDGRAARSTPGFSGTRHTEMNSPHMTRGCSCSRSARVYTWHTEAGVILPENLKKDQKYIYIYYFLIC